MNTRAKAKREEYIKRLQLLYQYLIFCTPSVWQVSLSNTTDVRLEIYWVSPKSVQHFNLISFEII